MMIIYYAHPMSWYNTERETADVKFLAQFGKVENPNGPHWHNAVIRAQREGTPVMQIFADYIKEWADVVAFRRFNDETVGAGVAREVLEARIWGKDVWNIHGQPGQLQIVKPGYPRMFDILSVDETRRRIKEQIL